MSENPIWKRQQQILQHLVSAGAITRGQAHGMAPSETMGAIVNDILRMASGKDDEVAAAVGKVCDAVLFEGIEEGRTCHFSETHTDFVIYDAVVYTPNPLENSVLQNAGALIRREKLPPVKRVGVIGAQRLAALRQAYLQDDDDDVVDLDQEVQKERAKKLVEDVLRDAAARSATDVHLQPSQQSDKIQVRFRIDGSLRSIKSYPISLHESVLRAIVDGFANEQIDVTNPQDMNFMFKVSASKEIELRVSTIPAKTRGGATLKVVLRLLANDKGLVSLSDLGMSEHNVATMKELGALPSGLVLVTGPTGSGKTTTLATEMVDAYQNDPNRNFHTLEEPVEMRHEGMTHTECGKRLSFADALRSVLRQDPDVILVGEIRDTETAELAYQAAMTGHLVFSTLHTNNAHLSVDRLLMMGIERDIIATNTTAIAAQRLIGKLCPHCRVKTRLADDPVRFVKYGSNGVFNGESEPIVYKANPNGCSECKAGANGMKGRTGIIEILRFTPEIQDAILDGVPGRVLRRSGLEEGTFKDLWDDGLRLVKAGVTTLEELERRLNPYLDDRPRESSHGRSTGSKARATHSAPQSITLHPSL